MASLRRLPRSPFWHAVWRDSAGKQLTRSTKSRDRNEAMTIALEWERTEKIATRGLLTEAKARQVVSEILERTNNGESLRTPSSREWLGCWLDGKGETRAETTAQRYRITIDGFLASLGKRADKPIEGVTSRDVQKYVTSRLKAGLAPSAYSGVCRTPDPVHVGQRIRFNSDRQSGPYRTPNPELVGQ